MKEGSGGGGEVSGWFTKEMKLGYYVLYILQLKKKKKKNTTPHTHKMATTWCSVLCGKGTALSLWTSRE